MKPYYQDDYCTIYHGDCREILPTLEPVDLVLTDPPYGIAHRSNRPGAPRRNQQIAGDQDTATRDAILATLPQLPFAVFGHWQHPPRHAGIRGVLIWDKGGHVGMGDLSFPWKQNWECVFVGGPGWAGRRGTGVLRVNAIAPWAGVLQHPHEKPVELCGLIVEKAPHGTILDPFMGSGTTLRAAKDAHRRAIGIEIEERYCEIAAKRLQQEVFDFAPEKPEAER